MNQRSFRPGFALLDLAMLLAATGALVAVSLPMLASTSCDSREQKSIEQLRRLGMAHAAYAADWDDRQFTLARDDLGLAGGSCAAYQAAFGCHPPVGLGVGCDGSDIGYYFGCGGAGGSCNNFVVVPPINFSGVFESAGSFRLPAARGFHEYVGGRFFDPAFYAPKDDVVRSFIEPLLDAECLPGDLDVASVFSASYVTSPAAMYHPEVFGATTGEWDDPDDLPFGYESPTVSQAKHPSLKSRMLEHHWLQNRPEPCNPAFATGYGDCEPYYFNHGLQSRPMTLFYDGHVRGLSTLEAIMADARVVTQTDGEEYLWLRDTPLGDNGYLIDYSYDFAQTSYHILTARGIRGRDTVSAGAP
ncbi:MAG: hypothetical protein HKO59_04475 [Phycisphaerales bacterium]|nr:hypothetical protein [Phycisphaerae bacterium]NNF43522.1 hypothetical protein [Phycisphaerales bacterium]NNM25232.1 hypothetical protein [Phycisphaerales bacterium]